MAVADKYAKTEPPTPKRKKEAREEGQVARSPEIGAWVAIVAASMLLPWLFSEASRRVLTTTASALGVAAHPSAPGALSVLGSALRGFFFYAAIAGGVFAAVAVAAGVAQVGKAVSLKAARPRLSHISPKEGLRRLFSARAGLELGKQVLKLLVLSVIGYLSLHGIVMAVASKTPVSLAPLLGYAASSLLGFIRTTAVIGLALGVGDYFIQRHRVQTSIKMTKQEVLDERKSQEGDPIIRSQLRRRQWSIARSKTLAAVNTADVVVTNPTHVAVALQYDPKRGGAPRVVAKGLDSLAQRIKEEAAKHKVPICEDPPLARYLYATCKVEDPIPLAVYTAVARLIAFVYSLSPGVRGIGVHRRAHSVVPDIEDDARLPDTEMALIDG